MSTDTNADTDAELLAMLEADMTLEAAQPILALAAGYFADTRRGEGPVSTWHSAQVIADRLVSPMPRLPRPLPDVARRLSHLLLDDVNRLAHPMYTGHQVSAPLPAAVWTDALISALNQSQGVREMSPSFTPLEHQVIAWMTDLVGWDEQAGGTRASGGTEATFAALLAARSRAVPNVWKHGLGAKPPVIVCGEFAHYAVSRAAGEMGLGTSRVIIIPSRDHHMDLGALRQQLEALRASGTRVMAVVAAAGCTGTGSFDDLNAIANLCDEFADDHGPLWLHVDAAHGGAALLSPSHQHRMRGLVRARSLTWDPHKSLLLPLSAGMVLVRSQDDLTRAFTQEEPSLIGPGASNAQLWDLGPRSFHTSRRADVLKLWVAIERYGTDNLARLYDRLCRMTQLLHGLVKAHPDFVALHEPMSNILCFAWKPEGVASDDLDTLTEALRERYNRSGRGFLTVITLNGRRVLRVTIMNARTDETHLARLMDGLAAEAAQILHTH